MNIFTRLTITGLLLLLISAAPFKAISQTEQDNTYHLKFLEKQTILLYSLSIPVDIDKVIINNEKILPRNERASQIEIMVSTIESNLEEDYISCGVFEIDPTEDTVICNFEPINGRFVRLKILASWGGQTGKIGEVKIGRSGAKIIGKITDSITSDPIENAHLSILAGEDTSSDRNGEFEFSYMKIGTYRLVIHKSGYKPLIKNLKIDSSRSRKLEIRLTPSKTDIFGIITDESDHVLDNVEVTVKDTVKSTKTDVNGLYSFENMKAGSVEIVFSKNGYFTIIRDILVTPGVLQRFDINLKAGHDNDPPVPLKLSPFAYSPSDHKLIGYPSQSIYLNFNEPIDKDGLNIFNYSLRAFSGDPETGILTPLDSSSVSLVGIAFHRGDKTGRTIKFNVSYSESIKKMVFIELLVKNVSDMKGNKIPESGYLIRNFSKEYYNESSTPVKEVQD